MFASRTDFFPTFLEFNDQQIVVNCVLLLVAICTVLSLDRWDWDAAVMDCLYQRVSLVPGFRRGLVRDKFCKGQDSLQGLLQDEASDIHAICCEV